MTGPGRGRPRGSKRSLAFSSKRFEKLPALPVAASADRWGDRGRGVPAGCSVGSPRPNDRRVPRFASRP